MDLARAEPHLDSIHRLHGSAPMMSCPTRAPNRSFSSRWRKPAAPRSGIPARGVWAGLPQFASVLREACRCVKVASPAQEGHLAAVHPMRVMPLTPRRPRITAEDQPQWLRRCDRRLVPWAQRHRLVRRPRPVV